MTPFLILTLLSTCLWTPTAATPQGDSLSMFLALPKCAQPCTINALTAGGCDLFNATAVAECSCTNVPLKAGMSLCVQDNCPWADQKKAAFISYNQCKDFTHESRQGEIYATGLACLIIPFVFIALRYYARFLIAKGLWWDDWMMMIAMVSHIGGCACIFVATNLGFGQHLWNVYPGNTEEMLKLFHVVQNFYIVIQVSAKLSLVLLYWRIFPTRWFRVALRCSIVWLVVHGLGFILFVNFQCNPMAAVWDRSIEDAKCLSLNGIAWAGGASAIFEDVVILLLPIPEVMKLQLTLQKKIAVYMMFAVGSFACLTSIIRLKYVHLFGNTKDESWENVDVLIWSIMEVSVAVVCACLPALRPLFLKVPGFFTSNGSKGGSSSGVATPAKNNSNNNNNTPVRADVKGTRGSGASSTADGYSSRRPSTSAFRGARARPGFEDVSMDRDEVPFATRGAIERAPEETELADLEKGVGIAR
ncbi:hypothetical protein MCOR14_001479 [Pyricularia oryzae]|nr:hypothetical protein MCOR34_003291 [Pyricularia oryzae]KAI6472778.1 hypothetical protein MCOR17_002827 [Pyricularia oryzae]KAI6560052.1 hypothetical protein MCOR04_009734 [Pyricularia oryzae]KAI6644037.1 hypothetical protein MCOR14_001479 [Pyricularia oryzae]